MRQFVSLGDRWFHELFTASLAVPGCPDTQIRKAEFAIGPVRYGAATDQSVMGSVTVARRQGSGNRAVRRTLVRPSQVPATPCSRNCLGSTFSHARSADPASRSAAAGRLPVPVQGATSAANPAAIAQMAKPCSASRMPNAALASGPRKLAKANAPNSRPNAVSA